MIHIKWIIRYIISILIYNLSVIIHLSLCNANDQEQREQLIYPIESIKRYSHIKGGSYFGYSIASYVGQSQPSCLVGAPQAKTNDNADRPTGAVYRLDLDLTFPFCSIVPIANTDEMRREHGTPTPGVSNALGGTVAAASNSVDGIQLGCDPQYLFKSDLMNQTLIKTSSQNSQYYPPIKSNNFVGIGNCALYTGTSMRYVSIDACQSQEEGTCLAGFSADVKPGSQVGEAIVALGMPGSYLTEGNVFLGHYRGKDQISAIRLKSSSNDLKHMGFGLGYAVALSKLIKSNISNDIASVIEKRNLIGVESSDYSKYLSSSSSSTLSSTSTKLLSAGSSDEQTNYKLLASSSMWINNDWNGIVMILNHALDLGGIAYLNDKWGHIGSFFGYSLAVVDLDGNGLMDIVVGSPYYTYRENRIRQMTNKLSNVSVSQINRQWGKLLPDIGRVYIFYGYPRNMSSGQSSFNKLKYDIPDYFSHEPIILTGPHLPKGRFGHSVVNLADVDGDGTEDLAVGCPYCSDPKGGKDRGAVFIYLGAKGKPITDKPFQSIWPSELPKESPLTICGNNDFLSDQVSVPPRTFGAFGWSLSAGSDLDGNHAPDLMVGDVLSDQVVLIRARNTIWFDSPDWYLPTQPTLPWLGSNRALCGSSCQFNVQLYVTIRHHPNLMTKKQISNWKIRIQVDLDSNLPELKNKRLIGRTNMGSNSELSILDVVVNLRDTDLTSNRIKLLDLTMEPLSERVHALLWKPIIINATITPILDPFPFVNNSGGPIASWILHPFLGSRQFVSQPMQFANPSCGPDNVCVTDLQVKMSDLSIGPTQNTIIYFRERISQRNLTVGIGNLGENAYAAQLRMTFPIQFSFTLPHNLVCQTKSLPVEEKQTQVLCDLGDPLSYTGNILHPFVFQLNTAGAFRALDDPLLNDQATANETNSSSKVSILKQTNKRTKRSVEIPDEVLVIAEVISGNMDINVRNNKVTIRYKLQLASKVELSSSSIDRTTIDSRNFSIQPYTMQRIHPETMGPELKHIYLVTNSGPSPLDELWVNVSLPMQTKDGDYLIYLLDRLRYQAGDGGPPRMETLSPEVVNAEGYVRGYCLTPEWALNPLRLNAVHRGNTARTNLQSSLSAPSQKNSAVTKTLTRDKRDVHTVTQTADNIRSARSILHGLRKRQQEIIKCGESFSDLGVPICATIRCRIDGLSRGDAVRIVIRGWVWADTYFRHKISDLAIVSEAHAELNLTAFGIKVYGNRTVQPLTISQNFVFDGINILLFREIPLWPIILGCILGLIFLTCIIYGMWKCGFFRRKRWYDIPNSLPADQTTNQHPFYTNNH